MQDVLVLRDCVECERVRFCAFTGGGWLCDQCFRKYMNQRR